MEYKISTSITKFPSKYVNEGVVDIETEIIITFKCTWKVLLSGNLNGGMCKNYFFENEIIFVNTQTHIMQF